MKKTCLRIFCLFALLICTAGVAWTAPATGYPVEVTDSIGNTITIEKQPQRIVLAGRATMITANTFYLFEEARDKVIAIGHTDQGLGNFLPYLDENFNALPQLPHEVGPEQVIAQRPDLVIVKNFAYQRLGAPLKKLGIPVIALSLESDEAFQQEISLLGQVLGYPERAAEIVQIFRTRTSAISDKVSTLRENEKPGVLLLYYNVKGANISYNIAPRTWIQTHQVEAAGGRPVWTASHLGDGWKTVNFEQIAAWDPDYIFITSYRTPTGDFFEDISDSSQWRQLRAMKEGRVMAFPADFYSWAQPDVRWILGTRWLAGVLHPDLFGDTDIMDEIESFYRDMYRLDEKTFRSIVLPRLTEIDR